MYFGSKWKRKMQKNDHLGPPSDPDFLPKFYLKILNVSGKSTHAQFAPNLAIFEQP